MKPSFSSKGKEYVNKVIVATDEAFERRVKWMTQRGWRLVAQCVVREQRSRTMLMPQSMMHLRFVKEIVI